MKRCFHSAIVLCLAALTGCFTPPPAAPVSPLSGTFSGQFRLLHRHSDTSRFDTARANISLNLQGAPGTFAVSGDTATVHAGSFGSFTFGAPYIHFTDKTYPKTGSPAKAHLNGIYIYYYDGTVLQLLSYSADTLRLQYDLRRSQ